MEQRDEGRQTNQMGEGQYNPVTRSWLHEGIFGAIANLVSSGSGLLCLFWYIASATLSDKAMSIVPTALLVFVSPLLLIGFTAGSISFLYRFGKPMALFAALFGSFAGFLAATLLLGLLQTTGQTSNERYPIFKYAGWDALAVTVVGTVLATVVILLAGLIRRVFNRVG